MLFQVHFLSLLMEERGAGDLADVADHVHAKLVRRHPHVFGDVEASEAGEVLRNWDEIKRGEEGRDPGLFGDVPENLPALLQARKVQRRAASGGALDMSDDEALADLRATVDALALAPDDPDALYGMIGAVLFAAVHVARKLQIDPELALRSASQRFRQEVE
ncbi:MAG: nucleoside triphosphate diphosphatase [Solirubrobacteraceae bacterium]|nr:nucleoside triphosphate diphosphatase [Solirubrobacteraceae bacterium]